MKLRIRLFYMYGKKKCTTGVVEMFCWEWGLRHDRYLSDTWAEFEKWSVGTEVLE